MNVKLKLDTTILQSNTSMHLIQYMIEQRNVIVRYYNNKKVSPTQMKELQDDFEYIMKKHADACTRGVELIFILRLMGIKVD